MTGTNDIPQGSPDEKPHDAYTEKVVCAYGMGGRKKCGSLRYVKKQDLFQCRFCRVHQNEVKKQKRRESHSRKRKAEATAANGARAHRPKAKATKAPARKPAAKKAEPKVPVPA